MSPVYAYHRILDACGIVCAVVVLLLTVGITADVLLRLVRLPPLEWMLELSEYALIVLTFLAAPWALREGAHVRVDTLVANLPRPLARACDILVDLLGISVSAVLLIWSVRALLASAGANSMVYKVLIFPEWCLYLPIFVASFLLLTEFVRRLVLTWRGHDLPQDAETVL